MTTALIFAVVILFFAVVGLCIAFFALARQVGVLFERIEPMGALMTDSGPKVGEHTPRFHLESLTGGMVDIGPRPQRSLLVFSCRRPARSARNCCRWCAPFIRRKMPGWMWCLRATAKTPSTSIS